VKHQIQPELLRKFPTLRIRSIAAFPAAGSVIFTGTNDASSFSFLFSNCGFSTAESVGKNP
jgi:hypothetical protein